MAQPPPESSQLRPQSSLDSSPVKPRREPTNIDTLALDKNKPVPEHHNSHSNHNHSLYPQSLLETSSTTTYVIEQGNLPQSGENSEKETPNGSSTVKISPNSHASAGSIATAENSMQEVRGSLYETRYNGDAPLMSTSAMSNTHPPAGPPRQSVSYAGPMSYPSAGMAPASHYAYPQPVPTSHTDHYRPTPTALPSMRTLDHGHGHAHGQQQQQQQQPPQPHALAMGAHMGAPMAPAPTQAQMGYYNMHPHVYGLPDPNALRFAIPQGLAADPRIAMSGGRHKKEIKRRTKTGCLTCRKRRIKCDEGHPTCNNCKKSKRECLGYDPIFKQQQGPASIQPAPSSQPSTPATTIPSSATTPTVPSSSASHSYQATYPPPPAPIVAYEPPVSNTPQNIKHDPAYDYSAAIDPALQAADASTAPSAPVSHYQQHSIKYRIPSTHTSFPAKTMKVDELVALAGTSFPPPGSSLPTPDLVDEMVKLYYEVYAPGLSLFFDTPWYNLPRDRAASVLSTATLPNGQQLVSLFASFIQSISKIKGTDPSLMVESGHLETALVWALARLPLYAGIISAEGDVSEARGRLQVFETLVSGETLTHNPLAPPISNDLHPLKRSELEFWYHLAQYLLQSHSATSGGSIREHSLGTMRSLLDGRENRDVLYSIAVLREYTPLWDAASNEQCVAAHLEESDARCKLAVATRFMRDESTSTGGTTNVIRRFSDLACRAFVRPAVNVVERGP
ncbi:transcriptional regulatory protein moc3 [Podospora fimiseda]|uniref:Transcriptional regulatory protein moc3 n=1 Tax=Podospora fimiseda TaxID=252190 RepID=A0AAN7BQ14_9PEZI|nr:transcriptional regulatory protein moc3 [Podospora fimiseda]